VSNFDESHINKAIEYAQTHCARPHITYTQLFLAADIQTPQWYHQNGGQGVIRDFMEAFHIACRKRGLPPFDAFVVNESGERAHFPGVGYFTVNGLKDPLSEKTTKSEAEFSLGFQRDEREAIREWCRNH